jgi:hypothetical protein
MNKNMPATTAKQRIVSHWPLKQIVISIRHRMNHKAPVAQEDLKLLPDLDSLAPARSALAGLCFQPDGMPYVSILRTRFRLCRAANMFAVIGRKGMMGTQ